MKKILVFICLMFISTLAFPFSIRQYETVKSEANETMLFGLHNYIWGLYYGQRHFIYFYEEMLADIPKTYSSNTPTMIKLICVPSHLKLNIDNLESILDDELEREYYSGDFNIALPLFVGLSKTFPCV